MVPDPVNLQPLPSTVGVHLHRHLFCGPWLSLSPPLQWGQQALTCLWAQTDHPEIPPVAQDPMWFSWSVAQPVTCTHFLHPAFLPFSHSPHSPLLGPRSPLDLPGSPTVSLLLLSFSLVWLCFSFTSLCFSLILLLILLISITIALNCTCLIWKVLSPTIAPPWT